MAASVELRCPHCGTRLAAYAPYPFVTSYTRCPQCGSVLPFVAPRDPAPLFSWEVYPGLYPPTPVPAPPSSRRRLALFSLLLAATLLLAGIGGVFAWFGGDALRPGSLTIGGTVTPGDLPGEWVLVQGENGFSANVSAPSGAFSVPGVPFGGVQITIGATGTATTQFDLFFSPVYSSVTGSPQQLALSMGTTANDSANVVVVTSEFPDLETFVATVWSGSGLLWIAAGFTALGVVSARRDRFPLVIVGGATAVAAPFILPLLGIDVVSEALTAIGLAALPVGVAVLMLALPPFARAQQPVEPI